MIVVRHTPSRGSPPIPDRSRVSNQRSRLIGATELLCEREQNREHETVFRSRRFPEELPDVSGSWTWHPSKLGAKRPSSQPHGADPAAKARAPIG